MLFTADDVPLYCPSPGQESGSSGCLQKPVPVIGGAPFCDRVILAARRGWSYPASRGFCTDPSSLHHRWWRENSMADSEGNRTACDRDSLYTRMGFVGNEVQASNGPVQGELPVRSYVWLKTNVIVSF